ncbi:MAG: SOS response-associated peptidase, partial [Alphaproteobacteria bacterium]
RSAFKSRRCLVPADGFYEWQKVGSRKQPYRITMKDDGLFAFAGLWERWERDGVIESFTIIVTEANELMKPIHDRMPVILDPADYAAWLDTKTPAADAQVLLRPFPSEALRAYPVSTRVNSPRNDDASVIEAA